MSIHCYRFSLKKLLAQAFVYTLVLAATAPSSVSAVLPSPAIKSVKGVQEAAARRLNNNLSHSKNTIAYSDCEGSQSNLKLEFAGGNSYQEGRVWNATYFENDSRIELADPDNCQSNSDFATFKVIAWTKDYIEINGSGQVVKVYDEDRDEFRYTLLTTAHSFYDKKTKLDYVYPEVTVFRKNSHGQCEKLRYPITRIASANPSKDLSNPELDYAIFELKGINAIDLVPDESKVAVAVKNPKMSCANKPIDLAAFHNDIHEGSALVVESCKVKNRPNDSPHTGDHMFYHDCNTGGYASGGVFSCTDGNGSRRLAGIHKGSPETNPGKSFGSNNNNVGIYLDSSKLNKLIDALEKPDGRSI